MKARKKQSASERMEQALLDGRKAYYVLKLYVTGATPCSLRAVRNLRRLCEERLPGQYELSIVDIYQQPALAREDQIVAAPTLVKSVPLPVRRIIGDMSDEVRVLNGLGLSPAPHLAG